mmetsp:Transcript_4697/g.11575  ORF Transcript_4697/g.11575 Transcript_4697/m.11575 type:complete len:242 (-) Transcript_4697:373-1098(-)
MSLSLYMAAVLVVIKGSLSLSLSGSTKGLPLSPSPSLSQIPPNLSVVINFSLLEEGEEEVFSVKQLPDVLVEQLDRRHGIRIELRREKPQEPRESEVGGDEEEGVDARGQEPHGDPHRVVAQEDPLNQLGGVGDAPCRRERLHLELAVAVDVGKVLRDCDHDREHGHERRDKQHLRGPGAREPQGVGRRLVKADVEEEPADHGDRERRQERVVLPPEGGDGVDCPETHSEAVERGDDAREC